MSRAEKKRSKESGIWYHRIAAWFNGLATWKKIAIPSVIVLLLAIAIIASMLAGYAGQ